MEKINNLELYDIYSTWHIPFWQTTWFYITVGAVITLIVGVTAIWIFVWYRRRNHVPQTAWQIALAQLHALQKKRYTSKAAGKQCYFTITSILKQYLHAQHQLQTIGKTDEELIAYLQERTLLTQPVIQSLKEICDGCLYIKFANQEAVQKQISEHLALSVQILEETRPCEKQA